MNPKRRRQPITEDLRLDPAARLCPAYDSVSIKKFYLPDDDMGLRVIDNCAEENQRGNLETVSMAPLPKGGRHSIGKSN